MFHNPGGGASVRGIETLFVGYMFHNPGGAASVGVLKHVCRVQCFNTRGGQTSAPPPGCETCTLQTMFQYP